MTLEEATARLLERSSTTGAVLHPLLVDTLAALLLDIHEESRRQTKQWCLDTLESRAAEFGAEEGVRLVEEMWFGAAEDPDGRPLHPRRS